MSELTKNDAALSREIVLTAQAYLPHVNHLKALGDIVRGSKRASHITADHVEAFRAACDLAEVLVDSKLASQLKAVALNTAGFEDHEQAVDTIYDTLDDVANAASPYLIALGADEEEGDLDDLEQLVMDLEGLLGDYPFLYPHDTDANDTDEPDGTDEPGERDDNEVTTDLLGKVFGVAVIITIIVVAFIASQ